MIRRPLWVPLDAEPSAEKPVCTARTDTHTHTHTHTPQRSPRASCSGKERSWSGCENLNTSCLDGCSCWHQTLVRKSQPEEKEGWRKSIRVVGGGGGSFSSPKALPHQQHTSQKLLSPCFQIISKHPSSSSPTAPPPRKDSLPACNCVCAPGASTRRMGVRIQACPPKGHWVLPGSQDGPRQTHMCATVSGSPAPSRRPNVPPKHGFRQ